MKPKRALVILVIVLLAIGFTAIPSFAWEICGKVLYVKPYQDFTAIGFRRHSDNWESGYKVSDTYQNRVTIITSALQALNTDSYVKIYIEQIESVQMIVGIAVFEPGINVCAP